MKYKKIEYYHSITNHYHCHTFYTISIQVSINMAEQSVLQYQQDADIFDVPESSYGQVFVGSTPSDWNTHMLLQSRPQIEYFNSYSLGIWLRAIEDKINEPPEGWSGPFMFASFQSDYRNCALENRDTVEGRRNQFLPYWVEGNRPDWTRVLYDTFQDAILAAEDLGPDICCGITLVGHKQCVDTPELGKFHLSAANVPFPTRDCDGSGMGVCADAGNVGFDWTVDNPRPERGTLMWQGRMPLESNQFSWKYDGVAVLQHDISIPNCSHTVDASILLEDSLEMAEMKIQEIREKAQDAAIKVGKLNDELEQAGQNLESAHKIYTEKLENKVANELSNQVLVQNLRARARDALKELETT